MWQRGLWYKQSFRSTLFSVQSGDQQPRFSPKSLIRQVDRVVQNEGRGRAYVTPKRKSPLSIFTEHTLQLARPDLAASTRTAGMAPTPRNR